MAAAALSRFSPESFCVSSQGLTPPGSEEECCQAVQGSGQRPGIQQLSPARAPSHVRAGVKRLLEQEPWGPRQVPK